MAKACNQGLYLCVIAAVLIALHFPLAVSATKDKNAVPVSLPQSAQRCLRQLDQEIDAFKHEVKRAMARPRTAAHTQRSERLLGKHAQSLTAAIEKCKKLGPRPLTIVRKKLTAMTELELSAYSSVGGYETLKSLKLAWWKGLESPNTSVPEFLDGKADHLYGVDSKWHWDLPFTDLTVAGARLRL